MSNNQKYLIAISCFVKFGYSHLKKLMNFFSAPEAIWQAGLNDLIKAGVKEKLALEFIEARKKINPDQELEKIVKNNIKFLTIEDDEYPALLKESYGPPYFLYIKGSLADIEPAMAVVGTRKFSIYGRQVTEPIIQGLCAHNFKIVSGLAVGIDTLAHQAALNNKGKTIAVLGSGLDEQVLYPSQNKKLAQDIIASGGAIISEFPYSYPPVKENFPQRNRIVAGMTLGTIIIEAPETSGALITARYALDFNREVFAVPGSIYNINSQGTNKLIKQGAHPLTSVKDILEVLDIAQIAGLEKREIKADTPEEEKILAQLSGEPVHIDKIVQQSGLDAKTVSSTLTIMEMRAKVRNLGGMLYVLSK